jgi:chromosome segregation ATPase
MQASSTRAREASPSSSSLLGESSSGSNESSGSGTSSESSLSELASTSGHKRIRLESNADPSSDDLSKIIDENEALKGQARELKRQLGEKTAECAAREEELDRLKAENRSTDGEVECALCVEKRALEEVKRDIARQERALQVQKDKEKERTARYLALEEELRGR